MGDFNIYAADTSAVYSGWCTRLAVSCGAVDVNDSNCYIVARNTRTVNGMTDTAIAGFILDGDRVTDVQTGTHQGWGLDKDGGWVYDARYREVTYYSQWNVTAVDLNSGEVASTLNSGTIADFNPVNAHLAEEPSSIYGTWLQHAREYFDSLAAPPIYVGVNGKARQVTDMYVGVNGKARKVKAIYVGVNGKAREVFKAT